MYTFIQPSIHTRTYIHIHRQNIPLTFVIHFPQKLHQQTKPRCAIPQNTYKAWDFDSHIPLTQQQIVHQPTNPGCILTKHEYLTAKFH